MGTLYRAEHLHLRRQVTVKATTASVAAGFDEICQSGNR
jgi:hypothetical protein